MTPGSAPTPQILILDTGGQYCHLIARKVRELGVYCEIRTSETPAADLASAKGIIISGGPASVYEEGSPQVDPALFALPSALLGICYGQQLMAYHLGGTVEKGTIGEYGMAWLDIEQAGSPLFRSVDRHQQVWMSHRDTVTAPPRGYALLARTPTCSVAAIADEARRKYGVQFHPEVVHTECGQQVLRNFVFDICGCERDWNPHDQAGRIEEEIRRVAAGRNVFFFVSGGVDSTVAFTLCLRALGPDRVRALYVDTGLMREGETEFVRGVFESLGQGVFSVEHAEDRFLTALAGVVDPEKKRQIIGQAFVEVQEEILESHHYLDQNWILGQGTIYPDTIESGGTAKADLIKTHHNRVAGIQKLISEQRIVEPLHLLYKDEVREVGRELGLTEELLNRHPFPGPGLAIRCLCSTESLPVSEVESGWILPVCSVGVQGDSRSYRPAFLLEQSPSAPGVHAVATEVINRTSSVNRVVSLCGTHSPVKEWRSTQGTLTRERLDRLRHADAAVRRLSHENGFDHDVWQFPVVLIPLGTAGRPDSVVLRPIHSVDGMTARSVTMPEELLSKMNAELLASDGICSVLYDLTHKPPGTIEWE